MIVVKLGNNDPVRLGQLIKNHCKSNVEVVVEIPMVDPKSLNAAHRSDVAEDFEGQDQWSVWHKLHEATNFSTKVRLVSDKISEVIEIIFIFSSTRASFCVQTCLRWRKSSDGWVNPLGC
jgi:hypothetical protein